MTDENFESVIRETVDGNLVTHFLFIAEVMSADGLDLRVATSDSLTAWTALGMLRVAEDLIQGGLSHIETEEEDD
jgi:hypothetical protein